MLNVSIILLLETKLHRYTRHTTNMRHFLSWWKSKLLEAFQIVIIWHFYATRWSRRVVKSTGVVIIVGFDQQPRRKSLIKSYYFAPKHLKLQWLKTSLTFSLFQIIFFLNFKLMYYNTYLKWQFWILELLGINHHLLYSLTIWKSLLVLCTTLCIFLTSVFEL